MQGWGWIFLGLILAKWGMQSLLAWLNARHARANSSAIPPAFSGVMDVETYQKSVRYTLEKNRLGQWQLAWDAMLLLLLLASGWLPWLYERTLFHWGASVVTKASFLFSVFLLFSLLDLPWDWHHQFRLEERFGFNNSTQKIWWADLGKSALLALGIGFPLILLLFMIMEWTGAYWWLWAWCCVAVIQMLFMILIPVFIMPLFYKFSPLPEGSLRDRLLQLCERAGFRHSGLQVIDGSKRSRHSNAFFAGLGRFRKIVLFDTLMQQLQGDELEAVLAHEIGHFRKGHIRRLLILSLAAMLLMFWCLHWFSAQDWLYTSFGFAQRDLAVAFLLFTLLAGTVSFWWSPLSNAFSRHYEYQADHFALTCIDNKQVMIQALRKLNRENLSNLTPHPWFSFFYYSHPTLLEREQAIERAVSKV